MSTQMGDVSLIKDEDVLKRMWEETGDFGLKKEIRSHMYKLREARLKDFYSTEEVSTKDTKRSSTETKSCTLPTHTDSIMDHSFLSMKSKEIRDSESPTRDVSYRVTDKSTDHGWNIVRTKEQSDDGKFQSTLRVATTSGTKDIEKGKLDYAAKCEQKASVFSDGDDKNYVKSVGAASNSEIKQEASGGDENSSFKTSSSKTSSSSRVVTEKRSTTGDLVDTRALPSSEQNVIRQIYTTNVPAELKNHPSYIDGNTKVTRETRTLADGSIVTTTKYETTGRNASQVSNKQQSVTSSSTTAEQKLSTVKSSATTSESHTNKVSNQDRRKTQDIRYIDVYEPVRDVDIKATKDNVTSTQDTSKSTTKNVESRHSVNVDTSSSIERYNKENTHSRKTAVDVISDQQVLNQKNTEIKKYTNVDVERVNKINVDVERVNKINQFTDKQTKVHTEKTIDIQHNKHEDVTHNIDVQLQRVTDEKLVPQKTIITYKEPDSRTTKTTTITTKTHDVKDHRDTFIDVERQQEQDNRRVVETINRSSQRSPERKPQPQKQYPEPIPVQKGPSAETPRDEPRYLPDIPQDTCQVQTQHEVVKTTTHYSTEPQTPKEYPHTQESYTHEPSKKPTEPSYDQPDRRQPIKPGKSEFDDKPKPTEGQYDTTYKTDYTNKRISVDVSPTHQAFASSLRSISPDRISKCSSPSRSSIRSTRTSTTSLRSSVSPDKTPSDRRQPRTSPDKYPDSRRSPDHYPYNRPTSPRKSPDKYPGNETVTHRKTSPDKRIDTRRQDVTTTTQRTDTSTRKTTDVRVVDERQEIDSSTLTRKKHRPSRSRSPSPRRRGEIITDLDDDITTVTRRTKQIDTDRRRLTKETRPTSLEIITTHKAKKITGRSPSSPLNDDFRRSPTKESPRKTTPKSPHGKPSSPLDRPYRGSPTEPTQNYPQGKTPEDKPFKRRDTYEERCRQILGLSEKTETRKDSTERITKSKVTKDTKTSTVSRPSRPNEETTTPMRSSPDKGSPKQYPAREGPTRSGEKPLEKRPSDKSPKGISEFPSQIRKSPEKRTYDQPKQNLLSQKVPESETPKSPVKQPTREAEYVDDFSTTTYQTRKNVTSTTIDVDETDLQTIPSDQVPKRIAEFPSQIRKSPERSPGDRPRQKSPDKPRYPQEDKCDDLSVDEYTTICKSSQKIISSTTNDDRVTSRKIPDDKSPKGITEFPSQVRKSPERETVDQPRRKSPDCSRPQVDKYATVTHQTTQKINTTTLDVEEIPLSRGPGDGSPSRESPDYITPRGIQEFPSQIRKSPEKETPVKPKQKTPDHPDKPKRDKPDDQHVEEYITTTHITTKDVTTKGTPTDKQPKVVTGYPSQIQKGPGKQKPDKPVQKSPKKSEPKEGKPGKKDEYDSETCEITQTIIMTDENVSLLGRRPEDDGPDDAPKKTPSKYPTGTIGQEYIDECTIKTDDITKVTTSRYPGKDQPDRSGPGLHKDHPVTITELKSYQQKTDSLEDNEYNETITKLTEKVSERPTSDQVCLTKEPIQKQPSKKKPHDIIQIEDWNVTEDIEFISKKDIESTESLSHQTRKSSENYPTKEQPRKPGKGPEICEFPSQIRKSPVKQTHEPYPETKVPEKETPSLNEFPSQIRKSPEREPLGEYPEKFRPRKEDGPTIKEFPAQIRKTPAKEPLEKYPEKTKPNRESPSISEFPSQISRIRENEPLEQYPEKIKPCKDAPTISEFPSQIKKTPDKPSYGEYLEKSKPTNEKPTKEPSRTTTGKQLLKEEPKKQKPVKEPIKEKVPCEFEKAPSKDIPATKEKQPKKPGKGKPDKDKPQKQRTRSSSSSSSTSPSDTEDLIIEHHVSVTESRIPVDEPIATKKTIDYTCREDEIERTDLAKHKTQELLEREIMDTEETFKHKTVKKDSPEKGLPKRKPVRPSEEFIINERVDIEITTDKNEKNFKQQTTATKKLDRKPSVTSVPHKKSPAAPTKETPGAKLPQKKIIDKTRINTGETEYITEYCKPKPKDVSKKPTKVEKITLYDVDSFNKEDNTIHIRTHRIDETVDKKKVNKIVENGDVAKKYITTKVKHIAEPKKQIPKRETTPIKSDTPIRRTPKGTQKFTADTTQTTVTKTTVKSFTDSSKPKQVKPNQETPKRHIVSTTITLTPKTSPKVKPSTKTQTTKVTTITKEIKQTVPSKTKPVKLQNGHISSDTEEDYITDSIENIHVTSNTRDQVTRKQEIKTTDDKRRTTKTVNVTRDRITKSPQKMPVKGIPKSEAPTKAIPRGVSPTTRHSKSKPEKCITTKSIIINNDFEQGREVIVNLQRSQSSREPTPDRLCPLPVTSDEEDTVPRYPDKVMEPDDGTPRRRPKKISNIPIPEGETTEEFTRVTEIKDSKRITEIDKVEETDESLLSVNKKISKFLDTAEQLTKKPSEPRGPAPKVERPKLVVDENLESDECLLSVSDKVSKFITTAEQLTASQHPERPRSPRCQNYPDREEKIKDKVNHFVSLVEKTTDAKSLKADQKVTTQEVKRNSEKPVSLAKLNEPMRSSPKGEIPTECVQIGTEEHIYARKTSISPDRYSPTRRSPSPKSKSSQQTPDRKPCNTYDSIKDKSGKDKQSRRSSSPKMPDSTPRRPYEGEPKIVLSPTGRLRSTESIKKAKALFENISKEQETTTFKQRDILSRPSVFEGRRPKTPDNKGSPVKARPHTDEKPTCRPSSPQKGTTLKSTKLVLERYRPTSPNKVPVPKSSSREPTPERDVPGYRKPLEKYHPSSPEKIQSEKHVSREPVSDDGIPGYMQPLEKHIHPHFSTEKPSHLESRPSHYEPTREGETPGYMRPLDRHEHPHSLDDTGPTHRPSSYEPTHEGKVPHYMRPLDKHSHTHSTVEEVTAYKTTHENLSHEATTVDGVPHYMRPLEKHLHPNSTVDELAAYKTTHENLSHEPTTVDGVPHYMRPLEKHLHPNSTVDELAAYKTTHENLSHEPTTVDGVPHYMRPLEKHLHPNSTVDELAAYKTTHDNLSHETTTVDGVPHYMRSLEKHSHPNSTVDELAAYKTTHENLSHEPTTIDGVPSYMRPLERHVHPHSQQNEPTHSHTHEHLIDGDTPGYMKPLDRHIHVHSTTQDQTTILKSSTYRPNSREDSPERYRDVPGYMRPLERHTHQHSSSSSRPDSREYTTHDRPASRDSTPDRDIPGYMRPLDRSLRPFSPHKKGVTEMERITSPTKNEVNEVTAKFGVTLRKTDTGRTSTTTTSTTTSATSKTVTKKSRVSVEKELSDVEIEEIFELEVLECMLETVTSYEIRRRVRSQIRLVKKLISENKLTEYINSRKTHKVTSTTITSKELPRRGSSPAKTKPVEPKSTHVKKVTEYQDKYTRKSSPDRKPVDNTLYQHTELVNKRGSTEATTEYSYSYKHDSKTSSTEILSRRSCSPETRTYRPSSPHKTQREPESKITNRKEATKVFQTNLKKTPPASKVVTEEKPSWITQRNLKKTGDKSTTVSKVTTTTSKSSVKKENERYSPTKDDTPTDLITSSYGVGPTDENGTPLFGLKALRAQNKIDSESVKVQGTVVRSHYYAENGQEPVGEVSVTKYSTDPNDLGIQGEIPKQKGLTSVTTTQKFGYKDTPSLGSLSKTKKAICDVEDDKRTSSKTTSKVTRRNSVKALSQKFIENAVETSKSERQTSYPKAGLILRTSSFKDSTQKSDQNDDLSGRHEVQETVRVATSSRTSGTETFLTNKAKVTGVQDVISRMKTQEVREGDSPEDIEARGLLNKFIGSQVILSGMEGHATASMKTSSTSVKKAVTKVTTTVMEGGKKVTKTRIFEHPINDQELDTIWDEQTLRLLLENSTEYEERKKIRARLSEVMAEQEACTELVEKATQEQTGGKLEERSESSKKSATQESTTTTQVTSRVSSQQQISKKPMSPFAKFRQLDKQNSLNSPSTPKTPSGSGPFFKFTDPAVSHSASTIKDRLLHWCRMKTKEYENIQLDNFSTSWADGLAFCALIHHFIPDAFDYHALTPKNRKHNFELAFRVADERADIAPLLDVEDMVATRKPDWKCVFTYVQTIYKRFKDED